MLDAFWRTNGVRYMTRGDYSDGFHTFGMEWSGSYIYTWVDSRLAVCFEYFVYENDNKLLIVNCSNLCMSLLVKSMGQCTTEAVSLYYSHSLSMTNQIIFSLTLGR